MRPIPHRVLPVLMYHRFGTSPIGDPNLWIPAERFSAQLRWLADHGYRTLSLDEAFEHLSAGQVPGRSVLHHGGHQPSVITAQPCRDRGGQGWFFNLHAPHSTPDH